jgi:hypothetical protein
MGRHLGIVVDANSPWPVQCMYIISFLTNLLTSGGRGSDGGGGGSPITHVGGSPGAGLPLNGRGHLDQRSAMMTAALEKIPLRIVSILEPPFLMLEGEGLVGNHRFRGYIKDLLEKLSQYLDRPYMLYLGLSNYSL